MEFKAFIGAVTVLLSIVGHLPYLLDTIKGKTKPHAYTWFIWALLTGIAFVAQAVGGAGPGAWTACITALLSVAIFIMALRHGTKDITRSDTLCLVGALVAMGLWALSNSPLLSMLLVTLIDILAFIPTVRKTWHKPHQETLFTYALNILRHGLTLFAIQRYSVVTVLYPAALWCMNTLMVALILLRKRPHITEVMPPQ